MNSPITKKPLVFRWIDYACDFGGIFAAVCLLAVTLIITYEVFMRYLFNAPTTWVQEMSIYLCIAIGFMAAAYALKNNSHFSVTLLVDRMTAKNRRRMKIFTCLLGMAYSIIFVLKGYENMKFAYDIGDTSTGLLRAPLWIPWLLVPIGGLLLTLQFINKIAEEIQNRNQD
jgi:C4-dicarboxylate transporter, DctQ subunit